jgi:hypothetical protein
MRPTLLPPLVIPKRPSRQPVLVASYPHQMEEPISYYRPSYHALPPKPLPPRPELKLDDIDDIDVFNFYNPCLLPPSPIRPVPAGTSTEPDLAELPTPAEAPAPCPEAGLRRSTYTASRRGRNRRLSDYYSIPSIRSESPPPPRYTPELRPPSPFHVPQLRSVSLPRWDASSSIYSFSIHETEGIHPPGEGQDAEEDHTDGNHTDGNHTHGNHTDVDKQQDPLTPYLRVRPDFDDRASQGGYQEREEAALRELWGVIDGLLGPGKKLGDFDAKSIVSMASSMEGQGKTLGHSRHGSGERLGTYGTQHEATWWRAFRQGLLLS